MAIRVFGGVAASTHAGKGMNNSGIGTVGVGARRQSSTAGMAVRDPLVDINPSAVLTFTVMAAHNFFASPMRRRSAKFHQRIGCHRCSSRAVHSGRTTQARSQSGQTYIVPSGWPELPQPFHGGSHSCSGTSGSSITGLSLLLSALSPATPTGPTRSATPHHETGARNDGRRNSFQRTRHNSVQSVLVGQYQYDTNGKSPNAT